MLLSAVAARAEQGAEGGPLLISSSSEVHGSVLSDTIVQKNCTLHVRGNLLGSLTIEPGANVIVEGSVDGKINNKGGRLLVNNKGLAACVTVEGPAEAEACGILKINLTNLAANYEALTKRTEAECAAMVNAEAGDPNACGVETVAFVRGATLATARSETEAFEVVEILVVGVDPGSGFRGTAPATYFMLVKIDERNA